MPKGIPAHTDEVSRAIYDLIDAKTQLKQVLRAEMDRLARKHKLAGMTIIAGMLSMYRNGKPVEIQRIYDLHEIYCDNLWGPGRGKASWTPERGWV